MTDRDDILLLLGEIKGQIAGFFQSQQLQDARITGQDARIDRIEEDLKALMWKVAGVVAVLEAFGLGAFEYFKG